MKEESRILALTPYHFIPAIMGGDKDIFNLISSLNEEIPLRCITLKKEKTGVAPFDLIPVLAESKLRYLNPFFIFTLRKLIKENQASAILIFHPFLAWQAVLLKYFLPFKLMVRSANIEYERFRSFGHWFWPIVRSIEHWVHKRADYNLFISEFDKNFAIRNFPLQTEKSFFIPFGVEQLSKPDASTLKDDELKVRETHGIESDERIILFNGTLYYLPNERAVEKIIDTINPLLSGKLDKYKIVICGKGLKQELIEQIKEIPEIIYTGFVDDIDEYFKACDLLLNPVIEGGGVKTKLVEALGFGKSVVSYKSGSYGVDPNITEGRLRVVEDYNTEELVAQCIDVLETPPSGDQNGFYAVHSWGQIAKKIKGILRS